jgi:hypothetical protein
MDCRHARLLLEFTRFGQPDPGRGELDSVDADALAGHLSGCPECAALARGEQALDARLGQAMRQVPVPEGLRAGILTRLAQDRPVEKPRWWKRGPWKRGVYWGTAAAALLAAVLIGYALYPHQRPALDLDVVFRQTNVTPAGLDEVAEFWEREGVKAKQPDCFDANFRTGFGVAPLPGYLDKVVPVMDFYNGQNNSRARVYIVSARQFDLRTLADHPPLDDPGYTYHLTVRFPEGRLGYLPGDREAYLIVYTGQNINWLVQSSADES